MPETSLHVVLTVPEAQHISSDRAGLSMERAWPCRRLWVLPLAIQVNRLIASVCNVPPLF